MAAAIRSPPHFFLFLQWHTWLNGLQKQYGNVFRIFTLSRPYVVVLDKRVSESIHVMYRSRCR